MNARHAFKINSIRRCSNAPRLVAFDTLETRYVVVYNENWVWLGDLVRETGYCRAGIIYKQIIGGIKAKVKDKSLLLSSLLFVKVYWSKKSNQFNFITIIFLRTNFHPKFRFPSPPFFNNASGRKEKENDVSNSITLDSPNSILVWTQPRRNKACKTFRLPRSKKIDRQPPVTNLPVQPSIQPD